MKFNLKKALKIVSNALERNETPDCAAVIVAGGNSTRMGSRSKQLIPIHGIPVIVHTARAFQNCPEVSEIILVCKESEKKAIGEMMRKYNIDKFKCFADSGSSRFLSARNGFDQTSASVKLVAVHDAARCMIKPEQISKVIYAAAKNGAAIAASPAVDTIKKVSEDGTFEETLDRSKLWNAQTPQIFLRPLLEVGYYSPRDSSFSPTDDAMLVETLGFHVTPVDCGRNNFKITYENDVKVAEALLETEDTMERKMKVGHGYDVHRLVEGRKFILGGVEIPYEKGLLGHSDADVLCHAICDALLGAVGERDIGVHFPDNDPKYEGISSILLLKNVGELLLSKGAEISNIDATVLLQEPHVSKYIRTMEENIARALNMKVEDVNLKATTEEKLGFTGSGEGVAAHAVCLVYTK